MNVIKLGVEKIIQTKMKLLEELYTKKMVYSVKKL